MEVIEQLIKTKEKVEQDLSAIKTRSFDLKIQEQKLIKLLKSIEKQIEAFKWELP